MRDIQRSPKLAMAYLDVEVNSFAAADNPPMPTQAQFYFKIFSKNTSLN